MLALLLSGCADNVDGPPPVREPAREGPAAANAHTDDTTVKSGATPGPSTAASTTVTTTTWYNGSLVVHAEGFAVMSNRDGWLEALPVDNSTIAIDAVVTWTSMDGTQDLDLFISYPGCVDLVVAGQWLGCTGNWVLAGIQPGVAEVDDGGAPGLPDSPAGVGLSESMVDSHRVCVGNYVCTWYVGLHSKAHVQVVVDYSLKVSLESRLPRES